MCMFSLGHLVLAPVARATPPEFPSPAALFPEVPHFPGTFPRAAPPRRRPADASGKTNKPSRILTNICSQTHTHTHTLDYVNFISMACQVLESLIHIPSTRTFNGVLNSIPSSFQFSQVKSHSAYVHVYICMHAHNPLESIL